MELEQSSVSCIHTSASQPHIIPARPNILLVMIKFQLMSRVRYAIWICCGVEIPCSTEPCYVVSPHPLLFLTQRSVTSSFLVTAGNRPSIFRASISNRYRVVTVETRYRVVTFQFGTGSSSFNSVQGRHGSIRYRVVNRALGTGSSTV